MKVQQKEILIVDGYNIINAWEKLKKISETDLNQARDNLNDIISEYISYKNIEGYLIYDAYNVKGATNRSMNIGNLEIVYTKENQTADSYIEKFLSEFKYKKHHIIRVATDDSSVQNIVLGNGGTRISTRELLLEIENAEKQVETKIKEIEDGKNTWYKVLDKKTLEKLDKIRKGNQ